MRWFWKWVREQLRKRDNEPVLVSSGSNDLSGDKSISFTMYLGDGGVVVQRSHYDPVKDRSYRKLLVIPEDKDIAKEVGEFVAMEIMRV